MVCVCIVGVWFPETSRPFGHGDLKVPKLKRSRRNLLAGRPGQGVRVVTTTRLGVWEKARVLELIHLFVPELAPYIRLYGVPVVLYKLNGYLHVLLKEVQKRLDRGLDFQNEEFEVNLWIEACAQAMNNLGRAQIQGKDHGNDVFAFWYDNGARIFPPIGILVDALRTRPV